MKRSTIINLNGHVMRVKELKYDEADCMADEYYHDCYVTSLNGEIERYDACDVVVLTEEEAEGLFF